jgi:hypothetical protein
LTDNDNSILKELISLLRHMNKGTAQLFSELSKGKVLLKDCKNELLDLKINVRSLDEIIFDINDKLINPDEELNEIMNNLLAKF